MPTRVEQHTFPGDDVSVYKWTAELRQHLRHSRFAGRDAAGQPDEEHREMWVSICPAKACPVLMTAVS